jgi:enterochelin esterase family protein
MPSSVATVWFESQVLQGNALHDPTRRALHVYLPEGYETGLLRYPVVYLLAGFSGSGAAFLNWMPWEENIQQRMDRLVAAGLCRPMLLAMPDCFTRYGGSQYIDSPATGRYGDYLLEVVEHVDANFRTLARREQRAVAGKSSGGFGALTAGMRHPEIFGLVADHSGDKSFEKCYAKDLLALPDLVRRMDVPKVLADPAAILLRDDDFDTLMDVAAMSACYSPNPASPLGFDWPVDTTTGELLPEVWRRWKAYDPVEVVVPFADALRSLRLLYLDCGDRDEYSIHLGCRLFSRRLQALGIPHRYEEFEGGHLNTRFRYDVSLAAISQAVSAPGAQP